MATSDMRSHATSIMQWLIDNAQFIGYIKQRPMKTAGLYEQELVDLFATAQMQAGAQLIFPDCSEMVTDICRWSGYQTPSGPANPYSSGLGNTDTMYDYLPHFTNPVDAHPGSIVIFGPKGATIHAAMVMEQGEDPVLFSHGSDTGPIQIPLTELTKSFGMPVPAVTFLNVAAL